MMFNRESIFQSKQNRRTNEEIFQNIFGKNINQRPSNRCIKGTLSHSKFEERFGICNLETEIQPTRIMTRNFSKDISKKYFLKL